MAVFESIRNTAGENIEWTRFDPVGSSAVLIICGCATAGAAQEMDLSQTKTAVVLTEEPPGPQKVVHLLLGKGDEHDLNQRRLHKEPARAGTCGLFGRKEGGGRNSDPVFKPHIYCAAMTYEMANKPEFEDLAIAIIHLTSETINRFTHIHQSVEDLIKKVQLLRAIAHETGPCFQCCVGWDALNAR